MNQILRCDWLPERARWSYLAHSGLPAVSRKKHFAESHIINPLFTKLVRSRWLDIRLVLFLCLWTSTMSRSIKTQKKNLANIQPSWPHTWSITHISCPFGTTRPVLQDKFPQKPSNKSFVDQVCSVKMAGYWPCYFFLWVYGLVSVSVQPSWPQAWSICLTLGWIWESHNPGTDQLFLFFFLPSHFLQLPRLDSVVEHWPSYQQRWPRIH